MTILTLFSVRFQKAKTSDDLLQLSGANPFASVMSGGGSSSTAAAPPAASNAFAAGNGSSPFGGGFSDAAPVNANGKNSKIGVAST